MTANLQNEILCVIHVKHIFEIHVISPNIGKLIPEILRTIYIWPKIADRTSPTLSKIAEGDVKKAKIRTIIIAKVDTLKIVI